MWGAVELASSCLCPTRVSVSVTCWLPRPRHMQATIEWEAQEEGVIAKLLVAEGSQPISLGTPVVVLVDEADAVAAFAGFTAADAGGEGAASVPAAPSQPAPAAAVTAPPPPRQEAPPAPAAVRPAVSAASGERIIASPLAKKMAVGAGITLAGVGGTGPGGRIVAADVQQLLASGQAQPVRA
jgi:pyruvate dehydrogenase E2 component (dihydrolipoamide acetyltransferase)